MSVLVTKVIARTMQPRKGLTPAECEESPSGGLSYPKPDGELADPDVPAPVKDDDDDDDDG